MLDKKEILRLAKLGQYWNGDCLLGTDRVLLGMIIYQNEQIIQLLGGIKNAKEKKED